MNRNFANPRKVLRKPDSENGLFTCFSATLGLARKVLLVRDDDLCGHFSRPIDRRESSGETDEIPEDNRKYRGYRRGSN
jgi:hypothetical protein